MATVVADAVLELVVAVARSLRCRRRAAAAAAGVGNFLSALLWLRERAPFSVADVGQLERSDSSVFVRDEPIPSIRISNSYSIS